VSGECLSAGREWAANEVVVLSRLMSDSPVRITSELQMPAVALAEGEVSGRLVVYADLGGRATTVELSDAVLRELESCESFQ
jgi:hypothetical protein